MKPTVWKLDYRPYNEFIRFHCM